ncbi:hypothetical protein GCM10027598_02240 [Amycolatopsis oliviviridis]|uniref:DUF3558 domain-containing protein n=1 Tax=Amycolatopsis oliviviridis TaxID=1471590 RepID=A0ABQ3LSN4_9PSEU|nr:DUF3558 domain-containing protein [Amycolatopsis oliviviridis]GHH22183.1 hypothetical protein GCM10017790_43650 [Amycolatopsis oliviviridis]
MTYDALSFLGKAIRMRFRLVSILAAACVLTAGCTGETGGKTEPSIPNSDTTALPRSGAPKVKSPLKSEMLANEPCSAATDTEIEGLAGKVKSSKVEQIAGGPTCSWILADLAGSINGGLNVSQPEGLSHLYSLKQQGSGVTTFKPLPDIAGYPAVVFANGGEGAGNCNLAVGIRDDMMYTVVTALFDDSPAYNDPCGTSVKLAELAIQRLKAVP